MNKKIQKWSPDIEEVLFQVWKTGDQSGAELTRLAGLLDRTPLAILVRMHKAGVVSTDDANRILAETGYPISFGMILERQKQEIQESVAKKAAKNELLSPLVEMVRSLTQMYQKNGLDPRSDPTLLAARRAVSQYGINV